MTSNDGLDFFVRGRWKERERTRGGRRTGIDRANPSSQKLSPSSYADQRLPRYLVGRPFRKGGEEGGKPFIACTAKPKMYCNGICKERL